MNTSESTLHHILDELSRSLHGCDPLNTSETAQVMRHLSSLAAHLEHESRREMLPLCRVALMLLEHLSRNGIIGPGEGIEVVEETVSEIRRGILENDPPKAESNSKRERESARLQKQTGLQLIDGRKLGEILVTLSMLSPDDIEKALKKQRLTGKKFGEVLVDMRILTKEAVESALRVQGLRKTKNKDPWMEPN